jgi:4-hydroxy-3-methylbut-2-en-1-yl diphosphate reductase
VTIVEELLDVFGSPVFVRHEIVHNAVVVHGLRARGAVFVNGIDEIPAGSVAVLSAHGSAPSTYAAAKQRKLRLFDATCPLVTKVHLEVARYSQEGRAVVVIGHSGHVEVQGILGYYDNPSGDGIFVVQNETEARSFQPPRADFVGYVTQTTLATDETCAIVEILATRFPKLARPHGQDICYATQNRQQAVRRLCETCSLILVIGAPHSSNSRRLVEVAERSGATAFLIQEPSEIKREWLDGVDVAGLTSSASAPEHLVRAAIEHLRQMWPELIVQEVGEDESVSFRLPYQLRALGVSAERRAQVHRSSAAAPSDLQSTRT